MFLNPLGLFALLSLPAILLVHVFRRRFRPRVVSALFLWMDDDETIQAGRRIERLRNSPSLWLELLAALLLALVIAGPRLLGAGAAEHLVCVLDASASMGAVTDGGPRRDDAVARVEERIDALSADSRVTLIESGARPRLLAGPAAFPAEARDALEDYRPSAARHELAPAVALGLQLAGDGAVLVVTDTPDGGRFPPEVELVSVGRPADNVAVTHAARTPASASEPGRVLVTLAAYADRPMVRELTIARAPGSGGDVGELERARVELSPDERRHLGFDVPRGVGPLIVTLTPDALGIDDRAYLAPPPERTLALATDLDERDARALGLVDEAGASRIDRWLALVPHAREAASPDEAHVLIARAAGGGPATWTLALEGDADADPLDLVGPFLAERSHPLLDGLTLRGVVWRADAGHALPGVPIVSAGNRPILTETADAGRRAFHLNLDPLRSSLQRSPDWPILLANLAEMRRAHLPGPVRSNVAVGEPFEYRGDGPATYTLRAHGPMAGAAGAAGADVDAREVPALGVLSIDDLSVPGLYALERAGEDVATFGVNFADPEESDLRDRAPGGRAAEATLAATLSPITPLESLLLAAALLAVAADWWVLRRGTRRRAAA